MRLRLRLDPERVAPAFDEADLLRRRSAETRARFQKADIKIRDADIDFEVARSYLNAGLIDRAEPLFLRARSESEPTAEISIELANLALKRGDPRRASTDPARGDRGHAREGTAAKHHRLGRGALADGAAAGRHARRRGRSRRPPRSRGARRSSAGSA